MCCCLCVYMVVLNRMHKFFVLKATLMSMKEIKEACLCYLTLHTEQSLFTLDLQAI